MESNRKGTSAPIGSLHSLFESSADREPERQALVFGERSFTFLELEQRSNRIAHQLRDMGAQPGQLVGVCLERTPDLVATLLAVLKSGAAYVPLDPAYPANRIAYVLGDAGAAILVTEDKVLEHLGKTPCRILSLAGDAGRTEKTAASRPEPLAGSEDLAYVIYTSGSTGRPKGVEIEHRAVVNFVRAMAKRPGLTRDDVLLAVTTVSFDIAVLELFLPMYVGATVVLASRAITLDPDALQVALRQHGVTAMQATPATWSMLVDAGWTGSPGLKVLSGGEAMSRDLTEQLLPRCASLWNMYGPTETTVWSTCCRIEDASSVHIGTPIANTQVYVLDDALQPRPIGVAGELMIGGDGVARGYLGQPELTAEKFVANPFQDGQRIYRTGDKVRYRADGTLEYLGRLDRQVKLRGFRIELGEIEFAMARLNGIRQAAVIMGEDGKRLVAYYTGSGRPTSDDLARELKATLPEYMVPEIFVYVESLPRTPNGKLDLKALPAPDRIRLHLAQEYIAPRTTLERQLADLWCELLQINEVGIDDSFFDLGGNSLSVVHMARLFHRRHGREIPPVEVFQHPTIAQLARLLDDSQAGAPFLTDAQHREGRQRRSRSAADPAHDAVAIIGMVGRFPGADDLETLWGNLCNGVESISFFKPEELGPGIENSLKTDPDYIRARGLIDGADLFDAAFFEISPLEARVMDPQQRVFLELAHHALENAGYDSQRYGGIIGVFAGVGDNHYYTTNLLTHPDLMATAGTLAVEYGNEKDYIALRTAYLLDLHGPAISINTACSTTLMAVDLAFRSLRDFECDMALAGGIDIKVPQRSGFLYQEGGTFAKDGHCRPFDADATGTMFCDGAGIVVLKRLQDALDDGDTIYALVRGSGKNNNGARPASFVAPSIEGQAEAIAMAQAKADVPVETIRYVEAHGTGTPVGDPIEIEALSKVFQSKTDKKQFCYIGSIKGNIGHSTIAAGAAGLIKAAMVLHREQIPATLHFKTPNPKLDFANSPFVIADRLIPFPRGEEPRRAGVSSFGFGGTNVHTILEEAPLPKPGGPSRPLQLLPLSARTDTAMDAYGKSLAAHLENLPKDAFADAAYTLQKGRKQMAQRHFVVAADPKEATQMLLQPNPLRCGSKHCERRDPPVVLMFGGQGTQYVSMGRSLYNGEPLFRAVVDDCCDSLTPHLGRDLRELLYPRRGAEETARISLQDTLYTQPAIFVTEYALARLWQSLGVQPAMMVGHSIGEFVAATLAEVWSLDDALRIIALRGKLMQDLPRGSMLAVGTRADTLRKALPPSVQIASINAPSLCVVAGPEPEVDALKDVLEGDNVVCRHLHTSHAFHSAMMDPMLGALRGAVAEIQLRRPTRPFVSTVTGEPITAAQATDPGDWANHARATVQFSEAVQWLVEHDHDLFLECGPRSTLCSLARHNLVPHGRGTAIPTLADTCENNAEWIAFLFAVGSLWQNGVSIDWDAFYAHEDRRRISLPTYPFERQRHWVDPAIVEGTTVALPLQPSSLSSDSPRAEQPSAAPIAAPVMAHTGAAETRKDRLAARLVEILVFISGRERSQISTSATFLEQDFDSLSLTQVAFAVRKEFGVKTTFSQLMNRQPNVDMMAEHLDKTLSPGLFTDAPAMPPTSTAPAISPPLASDAKPPEVSLEAVIAKQADTIACLVSLLRTAGTLPDSGADSPTFAALPIPVAPTVPQRGIFFSSRLSDRLSASYNESVTLRFTGTISVPKLTRAVERLVQRHEALRASFDELGSVMRILPTLAVTVPVTDLSAIADQAGREERLRTLVAQDTALPFVLPGGPFFRSQIVLLGADSAAIVFTGHHLVCDGWSLDVLIQNLCALYSEEISGVPVPLPPAGSYADYVRTVASRTRSPEFREAQEFWRTKFAGDFPVLVLPTDRPRSARREFEARRLDHAVAVPVVQDLRALAVKEGCSFFGVVLGALSILLARLSTQHRFVVALPVAEQPAIGQAELVGHCVNLLPFVVELREGEAIRDFLGRVQRELADAHDHTTYTLANLLEDIVPMLRLASRCSGDRGIPDSRWPHQCKEASVARIASIGLLG